MCIRINKIIGVISLLFLCNISYSSDLPECEGSPRKKIKPFWDSCYGEEIVSGKNKGKYSGEFKNNKYHGKGKYEWYNSSALKSYDGYWFEGKKHGKAKIIWTNGEVLYGDNVFDKMTGYAEWYDKNNKIIYRGMMKDSLFHGQGVFHFPDGKVWEGVFEKDKFISGTKYRPGEYTKKKEKKKNYLLKKLQLKMKNLLKQKPIMI